MLTKRTLFAGLALSLVCVNTPLQASTADAACFRPTAYSHQSSAAVSGTEAKRFTSPNRTLVWIPQYRDGELTGFTVSDQKQQTSSAQPSLSLSSFGLTTGQGWGKNLRLIRVSKPRKLKESYTLLTGKRLQCSNEANEVTYTFRDDMGHEQQLVVRLYNDGVAFRYELAGLPTGPVPQEQTAYHIVEGTKRWMQKWTEGYEDFFPYATSGRSENHRWGYPALLQTGSDVWALITEAGIERCHSASSLYNDRKDTDYRVVADENNLSVSGTWTSPWRLILMGNLRTVVESTLVDDVSAPSRLTDTSWIHPGSVSWIYWAHNHGSNDFQIVKQYVDMAVTLHFPYVLIDAEWDEMRNGGDINDAIRYAHSKGIQPILWYNSSTAWTKPNGAPGPHERLNRPEDREKEFAWLEKMGVAGVKIDFFAGDKQSTMSYCIDLLESAARHHLLVNFHGATIPRGWQRTYPNLMSVEGVYGAEWYNNNGTLTNRAAAHNATLPFTRNVIGPMDYTPCTFSDSQHPHITTRAHELALPVLFESALLHWADRPESYLVQPAAVQQFQGELPTVWDETRFVSGYPGRSVVMARRRGKVWYIAGINGEDQPQTLQIDLPFSASKHSYQLFLDVPDGKGWQIKTVDACPKSIECLPRGGFVIVVRNK